MLKPRSHSIVAFPVSPTRTEMNIRKVGIRMFLLKGAEMALFFPFTGMGLFPQA